LDDEAVFEQSKAASYNQHIEYKALCN